MRIFLIIVVCAVVIAFFSYDHFGELAQVFSSYKNELLGNGHETEKLPDEKKDESNALSPGNDSGTDEEERLDRSIKSVEDEIRRTEEFLQKKAEDSAR